MKIPWFIHQLSTSEFMSWLANELLLIGVNTDNVLHLVLESNLAQQICWKLVALVLVKHNPACIYKNKSIVRVASELNISMPIFQLLVSWQQFADAQAFLPMVMKNEIERVWEMLIHWDRKKLLLATDTQGRTALHIALENKNCRMACLLLLASKSQCKALLEQQDSTGKTPLLSLIAQNLTSNQKLIKLMMEPMAKNIRSQVDYANRNVVHYACQAMDITFLQTFNSFDDAQFKKCLCDQDNTGKVPLSYALQHGTGDEQVALISFLLACCGDQMFLQDNQGNTALHHATMLGNLDMVLLLMRHGADDTMKNKEGETAKSFFPQEWLAKVEAEKPKKRQSRRKSFVGVLQQVISIASNNSPIKKLPERKQSFRKFTLDCRINKGDEELIKNTLLSTSPSSPVLTSTPTDLVTEIRSSESKYLESLNDINCCYMKPLSLLETCEAGSRPISLSKYKTLFGKIPVLEALSQEFLADIVGASSLDLGTILPFYASSIFHLYRGYIDEYQEMEKCLIQLQKKNAYFVAICQASCASLESKTRNELSSLLVAPVQRLPSLTLLANNKRKQILEQYMLLKENSVDIQTWSSVTTTLEDMMSKVSKKNQVKAA